VDDATQRRVAELEAALAALAALAAKPVDDGRQHRVAELEAALAVAVARIAELEAQAKTLFARLGQNSGNSGKPPSSDGPSTRATRRAKAKEKAKTRKSGRMRGGQPGHPGASRALVPSDQVNKFVDLFPPECESCWKPLSRTPDPSAQRYQTFELQPVTPFTVEYRVHDVACECGYKTRGPHDQVPVLQFGPRLCAVVAVLTGAYHLSRRRAVNLLSDLVGVRISTGSVSNIEARVSADVKLPVEEAWTRVGEAPVKHTDGTSWYQAGLLLSLWTIATSVATVFKIVANGRRTTLEPLFGEKLGILVSDRATALKFWAMELRQICWAHLLRKFISFSERGGQAGVVGRELLDYVGIMFAYWDQMKSGKLSREEFREHMKPVRPMMEAVLQRAVASGIEHVSGSCANILEHAAALWLFVDSDDVEPTNNHAERELRGFVLWRKRSFGTQSDRGNLFAERLMTVVHTARKQNKNVLAFVTACCTAAREGQKAPSLFAA